MNSTSMTYPSQVSAIAKAERFLIVLNQRRPYRQDGGRGPGRCWNGKGARCRIDGDIVLVLASRWPATEVYFSGHLTVRVRSHSKKIPYPGYRILIGCI